MRIGIIGTGWIGYRLAKLLIEKGHYVKGTVTKSEKFELLQQLNIQAYELQLTPDPSNVAALVDVTDSDVVVICFPPSRLSDGATDFHAKQMRAILRDLPEGFAGKIVYTSSTSVYPENLGEVDEDTQVLEGNSVVMAEEVLRQSGHPVTVLRLGGLMGYNRIPGKYFIGKKDLKTGDIPVNFVHGDDVVRAIWAVIEQDAWGKIYNVVAPEHPIRRDIYLSNAAQFGFEPPTFAPTPEGHYKIVRADKICQELGFSFAHPDPLHFPYEQV
jgi:nucleoside-diphosphate-sugar epimerase